MLLITLKVPDDREEHGAQPVLIPLGQTIQRDGIYLKGHRLKLVAKADAQFRQKYVLAPFVAPHFPPLKVAQRLKPLKCGMCRGFGQ
jgi:hypothetical protein